MLTGKLCATYMVSGRGCTHTAQPHGRKWVYPFVWEIHFAYRLLWEQRTGLGNQQGTFQILRSWPEAGWQHGALFRGKTWHLGGGLPYGKLQGHCEHLQFVSAWVIWLPFKAWIKDTLWSGRARISGGIIGEPRSWSFCFYTEKDSGILDNWW